MRIVGCDLHVAQQTIAMLDDDTGEIVERTLTHDGETVREFYASIPGTGGRGHRSDRIHGVVSPVAGGVGEPVPSGTSGSRSEGGDAAAETRPTRCRPTVEIARRGWPSRDLDASTEQRDLRALLLHRHQWVRMRTRVAGAAGHGLESRPPSWSDVVEPRRPGGARCVALGAACGASP
jgi:hypothetical protein